MKEHTRQSVHDLIQSRWESDLPDRVLQALKPYDGKPITTRIEKTLANVFTRDEGGFHGWRIIRHFGWTSLENDAYWQSQGSARDGISLMLVRSEASVPLDLAWVEANNQAYFKARRARNHARMEAMNTKGTLDAVSKTMNDIERAIEALTDASNRLDDLTKHGESLDPDRFELQRACGLTDVNGQHFGDRQYKGRVK